MTVITYGQLFGCIVCAFLLGGLAVLVALASAGRGKGPSRGTSHMEPLPPAPPAPSTSSVVTTQKRPGMVVEEIFSDGYQPLGRELAAAPIPPWEIDPEAEWKLVEDADLWAAAQTPFPRDPRTGRPVRRS